MSCVSSWCFWKVFFAKKISNPDVDSRSALLGPWFLSVVDKCAQSMLQVARAASLWNLDIISTSHAYLAASCSLFEFASEEFFPVFDTGGEAARTPGVLTPR